MKKYGPKPKVFLLLFLCLISGPLAFAVQSKSPKTRPKAPICSEVLSSASPFTLSFFKLGEEAFKTGILSIEDLQSSALNESPHNLIRSIRSTEAQIFYEGFETVLSQSNELDWQWIQKKFLSLIDTKEQVVEKEMIQVEETKLRFAPRVVRMMSTPAISITSQATFFVSQDGRELVAFSTNENWAYILDLNNPRSPIKIPIGSAGLSNPVYFLTKQGKEGVAFASKHGQLFIVDLNKPKIIRTLEIGNRVYSNPVFFSSLDGRDFIAIGSDNYCIYLIDLNESVEPLCISTNGIVRNSIIHYRTKDQRDLVIAGSSDNHLYLVDVLNPEKPKKFNLKAEVWSSPAVFKTPDGRELVSAGTQDNEVHIVDLNRARTIKRIPVKGFPKGASSYFVKSNGQEVLSTGASGIFTISPLKGSKPIHQVDLHRTLDSDPISFKTSDLKEIVALAILDSGVLFTNLNDPEDNIEIQIHRANSIQKIRRKNGKEQILVTTSSENLIYFVDLYQENASKDLR